MPTGYTELLRKKNYNLKQWLKEDCIRFFGVCVCLREEGNLSESEIMYKLTELTKSHNQKPKPINDVDLKNQYDAQQKYYSDKLYETEKTYIEYKKSVKTLQKLLQYSKAKLTNNVLNFAIDQLNLIKNDFDFDIKIAKEQLNLSFEDFKAQKQKDYEYDLKYYKQINKGQKKLDLQRLEEYLLFVNEIDALFNKVESEVN